MDQLIAGLARQSTEELPGAAREEAREDEDKTQGSKQGSQSEPQDPALPF